MAQLEADGPRWFHDLDPLDALFLGTAWPQRFRDEFEFSNARDGWLRLVRGTVHWKGIERFVLEVVAASEQHDLPVDEGELMLLLAGRLEEIGLDQRKLPARLLPGAALSGTRLIDGPPVDLALPEPPADAAQKVAQFWESTQVEVPHDGTILDALREGVHLLHRAGLAVREESGLLLPALYLALVAKEDEEIEEAGPRSAVWALALPADSSLISVTDLLLVAPEQRLTADEALAHLFALPSLAAGTSAADRRWTSSPGRALIDLAFELEIPQVTTRNGKIIRFGENAAASFRAQLRRFEEKFGRPPEPNDPVFFDPDADTPRLRPFSDIETKGATLLEEIGLSAAWAFAYRETGGLLPRLDGTFLTERDAEEWDDAVSRYVQQYGGESPDFDDNMRVLRTSVVTAEVISAARDPEHGRELVAILEEGHGEESLHSFLVHMGPHLLQTLQEEPEILRSAAEFARAWSGAGLHDRVRDSAHGPISDDFADAPVLLAIAAATFAPQSPAMVEE
ncbi:hypothetical protein [Kitasatospora sp. NPDC057500]|uniref:hypothetical protein n=1 Tax=Kitasatospora sp. NPDC057500 TaxID=3346151 RepID=UPI0036812FA1